MKCNRWKFIVLIFSCIAGMGILAGIYLKEIKHPSEYTVCLNEICRNFSLFASEDAKYRDYIELYNHGEEELDLSGFYITDTKAGAERFSLNGKRIGAKDYLLVSLSKKKEQGKSDDYADLEVKSGRTTLYLYDAKEKLVDYVCVPKLKYDTSYARDEQMKWNCMSATPGRKNSDAEQIVPETLSVPRFSVESGFYEEKFLLELYTEEKGEIRYTLDGKEPSMDSVLYEEPLLIEDVTEKENVHSIRTDISSGFLAGEGHYALPEDPVDKAVIVRAAVFGKDGKRKSETVTKTYFVGFGEKEGYENYPVISLVTDPENLFDYQKGIYVLGEKFDQYKEKLQTEGKELSDNWQKWKANYRSKGRTRERAVHIDYFDAKHHLILSEEGGVRIKGGATRSFPQKSLGLYAREIYSGKKEFSIPFFGEYAKRDVLLFSGANDTRLKIRDVLIHNVCTDLAFSTMLNMPCYVFLDGEFWGIYHLMESYGGDYIAEHFGVAKEDIIMIKGGYLECGEAEDILVWEDFKELSQTLDCSKETDYLRIQEEMDLQSFLDYYGTQIYIARCEDWPGLNEATWKTKTKTDQEYEDGRWRWMIYDLNWSSSCLSEELMDANTIAYVKEESSLFQNLMKNQEFRRKFVINFCDLANTCFAKETVLPEFLRLYDLMKEPMEKNFERFYGENRSVEDYEKEALDLYQFLEQRSDFIMPYVKSEFELEGTLETLKIEIKKTEGGYVLLNHHVVPDLSSGVWTGKYFTDYPVTVTAVPNSGYHFAGWNGEVSSAEEELVLAMKEGGISLKAMFEKDQR